FSWVNGFFSALTLPFQRRKCSLRSGSENTFCRKQSAPSIIESLRASKPGAPLITITGKSGSTSWQVRRIPKPVDGSSGEELDLWRSQSETTSETLRSRINAQACKLELASTI